MKKSFKIIPISIIAVISVCAICLIVFDPFSIAYVIGSIFVKNHNDDKPFSTNGLFIYENHGEDEIDISRIDFSIKESPKQECDVIFKTSKNINYGIDIAFTIGDESISEYSLLFLSKKKELSEPHHYYYLYYFELKTKNFKYVFDLEPKGENFLAFSFDEPINTYVLLKNQLTPQEIYLL